jgi:hypothetical protein
VTGGSRRAPVTGRVDRVDRDLVRAESWVALCHAASRPEPTPLDWARLGVAAQPVLVTDLDVSYGVWRTLAWLLGVRPDPPVELPERDEDGRLVGGPRYAVRPDLSSPIWRMCEARRWERQHADALHYWEHVRALADAR